MTTRVAVMDGSTDYLDLFALTIARVPELELIGTAGDGYSAVRLAVESDADVALLDLDLPDVDVFAAAWEIRRLAPGTTVFLTSCAPVDEVRRRQAEELDLYVFEKLKLVATIELLARLDVQRRAA